jgi:hypothetical protein
MPQRTPRPPLPAPVPIVLPPGASPVDAVLYQQLLDMQGQLRELRAMVGQLPAMLEAIVSHLEAAQTTPAVPIASYEAMYEDHPIEAGPPEGELVAEAPPQPAERPLGWWGRLFTRRTEV